MPLRAETAKQKNEVSDMKKIKRILALAAAALLLAALAACGGTAPAEPAEKNGDVMILFTSDVHCGIDKGFGYAGVKQIRDTLEAQGYTTLLVDDGDAIQGEAVGTMTKGEAIIDLMNALHYDAAIPGNHEFDYGTDRFLALAEKAEFPYISCNFTKEDQPVFAPFVIKEAAGIKIAFVGVTTPETITSSTPAYFQNEAGDYIYGFMQDKTGEAVYSAVQNAVDTARAQGADYVYAMGHLGMSAASAPWTYADVISNTSGIDVFLDGHTHDTEQVVMKNKDGKDVVRSACGTKLNCIGYSEISTENGITDTNIWSWTNDTSAPELLGFRNEISDKVDAVLGELETQLKQVVANTAVELTISDPEAVDASGNPIRMVRRAETNLGDLCADAILQQSGADAAVLGGGSIRISVPKGDITYRDILNVHPFGNQICVIEVTGQQILDGLEWGAAALPDEFGGFLQVAGMTYEIDLSVPSGCKVDENNMFVRVEGARRVKNVTIGGEPLEPEKTYKLAGLDYTLLANGDGYTAFDGAKVLQKDLKTDNQGLMDFVAENLGGKIGTEYADPYGQGRIVITGGAE